MTVVTFNNEPEAFRAHFPYWLCWPPTVGDKADNVALRVRTAAQKVSRAHGVSPSVLRQVREGGREGGREGEICSTPIVDCTYHLAPGCIAWIFVLLVRGERLSIDACLTCLLCWAARYVGCLWCVLA